MAPASNSSIQPLISSVTNPHGNLVDQAFHSIYNPHLSRGAVAAGAGSSAVIAPVGFRPHQANVPSDYQVKVSAENNTSGNLLVGFYLPGDANGDGKVTIQDLQLIRSEMGAVAGDSRYSFDADTNRDGRIGKIDLAIARQNLGVSTTIKPLITSNLDPASDSGAQDRVTAIRDAHFTGTASAGAKITYHEINNKTPDVTTTADAQGNYSITVPLGNGLNQFQVTSTDTFGQTISGQIAGVTYNPIIATLAPEANGITATK